MNLINYFKSLAFSVILGTLLSFSVQSAHAGVFEDFFEAVRQNKADEVARMLRNGMDANGVNEQGTPALILAVTHKSDAVVTLLLAQRRINIDAAGPTGETAIAVAAWNNRKDWVDLFVQKGSQINRPGWTALHYAAAAGHKDLVKHLLEQSAYIDAHSPNKTTPLMMAARERQTDVVKLLLEEGADPSQVNDSGLSAADYLDRHKEASLAKELRERAVEFSRKYAIPAKKEDAVK